jgi:hypothetical protein
MVDKIIKPQMPKHNAIQIGALGLQSSHLNMNELISFAMAILKEPTFEKHLNQIKLGELGGSASYTG